MFNRKSQDMVIPHKKADNHYDSGIDQVNFFFPCPKTPAHIIKMQNHTRSTFSASSS